MVFPRTDRDLAIRAVANKLHPPRDGIPPRKDEKTETRNDLNCSCSSRPAQPFSAQHNKIPWDILMVEKSSDTVAAWRLANLTFTSAEYLRSNPQGGNSLEGRLSVGRAAHAWRHILTCITCGGVTRRADSRWKRRKREGCSAVSGANRVCPKNRRFSDHRNS